MHNSMYIGVNHTYKYTYTITHNARNNYDNNIIKRTHRRIKGPGQAARPAPARPAPARPARPAPCRRPGPASGGYHYCYHYHY